MKKHFLTGLVVLLPIALTITIVFFAINFLTEPLVSFVEQFLQTTSWYMQYQGLIRFALKILLLLAIFYFTVSLGLLARIFVFRSVFSAYEYLMHRIPIIKTIYKATQQVIQAIFGSSTRSFKQVVMVPFPVSGAYAIGLVSSPAPPLCEKTLAIDLVSVFVPTTPNPTSGYLMMYPREDVIFIDMKIEDALKYIISCGVISSNEEPAKNEIEGF